MDTIAKIKIDKLSFPNEKEPALKNINFEIKRGDFIAITGGVASGKSVLLHSLTGAIPHYYNAELTGKVTILGQDVKGVSLNQMSDYVGYMMQEPHNQIVSVDVYEDVAFGLANLEVPSEQIEQIVNKTLEFVGLAGYAQRQTAALSGGQAQRLVLAGVLALNAPILILDQPTAELDPQGRWEIYKRLSQLNKTQNLTIVMVMDRIEEVLSYANRVVYLKDGEIIREYSPREYYNEQILPRKRSLEYAADLVKDNGGFKESIAKISNVSYRYKNDQAGCEDINLEIFKGDFLSIIGVNGSGKSTLAKLLVGLLKPCQGEITLFNRPMNKKNLAEIRSKMGFVFQNPDHQIFAGTLEEEVGFSLKLRGEGSEAIARRVEECLEFVGLSDYQKKHPQRLSRGQRQLLALASILAGDPQFIIADEPTSGLDDNQGYMIMNKLYDLSQKGKTILLITHDLTLARVYSNRLVALNNHRLQYDIAVKDLAEHYAAFKDIGLNFRDNALSGGVQDEAF
ncbi:energy-coupling factor transporter ATPase [Desulfosporosinus sp. PR]|uniref:ABC transporter ATP-binding protein n=1 Tax=Candidatus Desulfosporosinus nitrosoreducens TaxID=3401928 RepID=UPI0027EC7E7E|nr:energy-coupling factor transporter ATPase [Desulfosporosinus sp. PR]MDQ7097198.1 energy-coupling factor transporter ATPase [Desulfosporosinus sp. PR]